MSTFSAMDSVFAAVLASFPVEFREALEQSELTSPQDAHWATIEEGRTYADYGNDAFCYCRYSFVTRWFWRNSPRRRF